MILDFSKPTLFENSALIMTGETFSVANTKTRLSSSVRLFVWYTVRDSTYHKKLFILRARLGALIRVRWSRFILQAVHIIKKISWLSCLGTARSIGHAALSRSRSECRNRIAVLGRFGVSLTAKEHPIRRASLEGQQRFGLQPKRLPTRRIFPTRCEGAQSVNSTLRTLGVTCRLCAV